MDLEMQEWIFANIEDKVTPGCWEWSKYKNAKGYPMAGGNNRFYKKYNKIKISCLSYIAFNGEYDKKLFIRHKCHNTSCINPAHLQTGTLQDNSDDKMKAGRDYNKKGSGHPRTRLNESEVMLIKSLKGLVFHKTIGNLFGVSKLVIDAIMTGRNWGHVVENNNNKT